jgi:hypothetical protein
MQRDFYHGRLGRNCLTGGNGGRDIVTTTETVIAGALLALTIASPARSELLQEESDVRVFSSVVEVRRSPVEEVVRLIGYVSAERELGSESFKGYYLTDRFGSRIVVRTTSPLPEILTRLTVTGVLLRNSSSSSELYIAETGRRLEPEVTRQAEVSTEVTTGRIQPDEEVLGVQSAELRALEGSATGSPAVAAAPATQQNNQISNAPLALLSTRFFGLPIVLVVTGMIVIGLLGFAGISFASRTRQGKSDQPSAVPLAPFQPPVPLDAPASTAPSSDHPVAQEFKTVRVFKTTRLVPIALEVMDGDSVVERIQLYDQTGEGNVEIGRDAPGETAGVRIKDPTNTLSRHQARLDVDYQSKTIRVTNLATESANATTVNGRSLAEKEATEVKSGDRLHMGAMELRLVVSW